MLGTQSCGGMAGNNRHPHQYLQARLLFVAGCLRFRQVNWDALFLWSTQHLIVMPFILVTTFTAAATSRSPERRIKRPLKPARCWRWTAESMDCRGSFMTPGVNHSAALGVGWWAGWVHLPLQVFRGI